MPNQHLQVAWHQGTPICQCVYSSLYYHNFQLLFTGYDSGAAQLLSKLSLEDTDAPSELITVVLKSYILSYRKTLDLVFVELAKGNVVDGEDCWLDDYGLGVTLTDEVEEVLELGDVAEEWLRSSQCPGQYGSHLVTMLISRTSRRSMAKRTVGACLVPECEYLNQVSLSV